MNITPRQTQILVAIIEQYAEVASPVGSVTLAKLFGVSSATIRASSFATSSTSSLMDGFLVAFDISFSNGRADGRVDDLATNDDRLFERLEFVTYGIVTHEDDEFVVHEYVVRA